MHYTKMNGMSWNDEDPVREGSILKGVVSSATENGECFSTPSSASRTSAKSSKQRSIREYSNEDLHATPSDKLCVQKRIYNRFST